MLIAPAALLLAWEGLRAAPERGGRGYALAGGALALVSVAFFLFSWSSCLPPGATRFGFSRAASVRVTNERPDPARYVQTIMAAITERQRWRDQYAAAKAVDSVSGNWAAC